MMTASRVRAVTFDVDGTLYDKNAVRWAMVLRNITRLRAMRVGMRVREELRGRTFESGAALGAEEARIVAERLGLAQDDARRILDDIFERTLCVSLRRVPSAAMADALAQLAHRGVVLAAVSDRRIDDKLVALRLQDAAAPPVFGARVSADVEGMLKPDPALLIRAAERLGVPMSSVVHIGDRDELDGEMARRAGARFILVRSASDTCDAVMRLVRELDGNPPPT